MKFTKFLLVFGILRGVTCVVGTETNSPTAEKEPITKSDKWRIITDKSQSGSILDVNELNFYSDASCSSDSKVSPNGEVFSSAYHQCCPPENAFNSGNGHWGGRRSGGFFWLGMKFDEVITVKCIEILQKGTSHYGTEWTVEAQIDGDWAMVAEKKNILPSTEPVRIQWVVDPCTDDPNFVKSRGGRQRTCQYIKDGRDHRKEKWCNKSKGGKPIKDFCCKTCKNF